MDDSKRGVIVKRMGLFVAVPISFINDERITNAARCLWTLLSSYTSAKADEAIAFPSYQTIMKRLGWGSKETVAAALLNLIQHGWIERQRRYSSSSVYTINYEPGEYRPEIELSPVVRKSNHQKSGNRTTDGSEIERQQEVLQQEVLQQEVRRQKRPVPNLDALAQAAKVDKMPSARIAKGNAMKAAAPSPFDLGDLENSPAIQTHRRVCGYQPMTIDHATFIISQVNGTAETTWPEDLLRWTKGVRKSDGEPYRLDAYEKQVQFHLDAEVRRRNGAGRPSSTPRMSNEAWAALEALAGAKS